MVAPTSRNGAPGQKARGEGQGKVTDGRAAGEELGAPQGATGSLLLCRKGGGLSASSALGGASRAEMEGATALPGEVTEGALGRPGHSRERAWQL